MDVLEDLMLSATKSNDSQLYLPDVDDERIVITATQAIHFDLFPVYSFYTDATSQAAAAG